MTYRQALKYLDSFINFEKVESYGYKTSLKLERMRRFVSLLGDPQDNTGSIHVAGSKGKGSTAVYIHSILRQAGFNTGLYTSPHLVTFRERIRINDELISEEDISRILAGIKGTIDSGMKDDMPTFFEVCTAIAYIYFSEKKINLAVYEVGLGGRLDATNVIEPLVCAITPLSYEHTDKLGNTLCEIAAEKCGIIKSGSICVSAPQEREALEVIEKICDEKKARLILVGRDIYFKEVNSSEAGEIFDVSGISNEYHNLKSQLLGGHQVVNAATAISVIEVLKLGGMKIPDEAVIRGIEAARWDGRMEIVSRKPYIVLDGAQNRASAEVLAGAVKKIFNYNRLILVFGVSKDKDIKGILEELIPITDSVVLTKSEVVNRALEPAKIKEALAEIRSDMGATVTSGVKAALDVARANASPDDLILVTGSLFVVGEAISVLRRGTDGQA